MCSKVSPVNIKYLLHFYTLLINKCFRSLSEIDVESMPLGALPEKFLSFPKNKTQLEDLEKIDLFNGPVPGKQL